MPRTRDTQAIQERLSDAVFETLAELGPAGFTLRAVAERANCTTGLVLHTFRDKQALLLHARDVLHQRTRARSDALEQKSADAGVALRAVVLGALPTDPEKLAEARVWIGFLAAALSDPALEDHHARNSHALTERLARLLGAADPRLADVEERAATLAAAVEGIATLAAGNPAQWPAERQRRALERVIAAVQAPGA